MSSTSTRSYLQPPRKYAPETDVPTLRPGVDPLPVICSECGSGFLDVEPPLGLAPFGVVTCNACGAVMAHLTRPLARPLRRERVEPSTRVESPPPPAVEPEGDWRLPGCTAACFGGRHHPLVHEAYGRRLAEEAAASRVRGRIVTGPLAIDFDLSRVELDGVDVGMTHVEWLMIARLARELGAIVTYAEMLDAVWGFGFVARVERSASDPLVPPEIHIIHVNLARLRARLKHAAPLVRTIPSKGLVLVAAAPGSHP